MPSPVASPQIPQDSPQPSNIGQSEDNPTLQPPQAKNTGGWLKQSLQRFAYYGGQAALKHVGLPTDDELQMHKSELDLRQQQIDAAKTANQQAVTMVDTPVGRMPQAAWNKIAGSVFGAQQKTAQTNAKTESAERIANINQQLKASGQGVQLVEDEKGKVTLQNLAKDQLPLPVAAKLEGKPNEIQLIQRAQAGDKEAATTLGTLQKNRMDLVKARGAAFGQGRLWSLQRAMDPDTGQSGFYTGFDILRNKQEGKNLIPMGALSAKDMISVQQLTSEAIPAIKGVEDNLSAFDNPNDRAIFARVLKGVAGPTRGNEATWMGNVLNQALTSGLSPQGQKLAQADIRLAETMGRLRSTLGLPATDQSMAVTLGLLPGASTPDSKYARGQVQQLREMVDQATKVPIFGGSGQAAAKASGKQLDAATAKQFLDAAGGNPAKARAAAKAQGYSF
jgi:hypothetical protein